MTFLAHSTIVFNFNVSYGGLNDTRVRVLLSAIRRSTADLMSLLHRFLDSANPDHIMLWAAHYFGFFHFLRGGEFTVNCTFDRALHLTLADDRFTPPLNPQKVRVIIKSSKTVPFRKGYFNFLRRGSSLSFQWFPS